MANAFSNTPDVTPFSTVPDTIALDEMNNPLASLKGLERQLAMARPSKRQVHSAWNSRTLEPTRTGPAGSRHKRLSARRLPRGIRNSRSAVNQSSTSRPSWRPRAMKSS